MRVLIIEELIDKFVAMLEQMREQGFFLVAAMPDERAADAVELLAAERAVKRALLAVR